MNLKEEDFVERLFIASSKDTLLVFTSLGKVYALKTYQIPQGTRISRGRAIANILNLSAKEEVASVLAVKEFEDDKFVLMCTQQGMVKRCSLDLFSNIRKTGIIATTLGKSDNLISVALCSEDDEVILATRAGKAIRFKVKDIRSTGRQSQGVRGVKLAKEDKVIGVVLAAVSFKEKELFILTATEKGFAKRTLLGEYRLQSRGGKGVINIKTSPKIGPAVKAILVRPNDEVMCITEQGILIRIKSQDIRSSGRSTQGVKIINLDKNDKLVSIARISE